MSFTLVLLLIGLIGGVGGAILAILIGKIFLSERRVEILIERNKNSIGKQISTLFADSFDPKKLIDPLSVAKSVNIKAMVEPHIDLFLRDKLPKKMPVIAMFIGDKTIAQLKEVFIGEIEQMFPTILNGALGNLTTSIKLDSIIAQKIQSISTEQIYKWVKPILSSIFKKLLLLGFVIGFVVSYIVLVAVWQMLVIV